MTKRARLRSHLGAVARASIDPMVALLLAAGYVALLLSTVDDLGYARDEGFYIQAANQYRLWFDQLFADPSKAMEPAVVDRYWKANHEHPAFMKSLFALSNKFLEREWKLFPESGTSYRFPGMVLSGIAVGTVYLWGRRALGRWPGLVAAILFAMMPRVFYHSHLDCFDMPVAAMWLVTTYAYARSFHSGGIRWALAAGVLYGFLLNTKHNAWLLPPALIAHFLIVRGITGLVRDLRVGRTQAPLGLIAMAVIGPAVFLATWPWIWNDTVRRLGDYVAFHTGHEYYNMEFFGVTYFEPPMPLGYAWVMTIATVPAITLLLFGLGLFRSIRELLVPRLADWWRRVRKRIRATDATVRGPEDNVQFSTRTLWLLCLLMSYAPWVSSGTPIFGGTKHWITAYPFLCLFAAVGFKWVSERVVERVGDGRWRAQLTAAGLAAAVLIGPVVMTLHSHPWGLTAYTPIVGGAPGAASLGLNRSFWGYTTGAVTDFLNNQTKGPQRVYLHDTAPESWKQLQRDGRVERRLNGTLTLTATDVALYHHEQHMGRVEYQYWVDYGTVRPAHIGDYDGVPVIWIYVRPEGK